MITSLFFKQRDEKAFFSWLFLGPVLMTLSASLALVFTPSQPVFLALLVLGLFTSIFFDKKGLLASSCCLAIFSLFMHLSSESSHIWLLSLEFSMAFGLYFTNLSFQEAKRLYVKMNTEAIEKRKKTEVLTDQIEEGKAHFERYKADTEKEVKDLRNHEEQLDDLLLSYRKLTDLLTERDKQNKALRNSYDKDILTKEKEIIALKFSIETYQKHLKQSEDNKKKYLSSLNDLRQTFYQKRIIEEHKIEQMRKMVSAFSHKNEITKLEKKHLEEKLVNSQTQIKKLCIRLDELSLRLNEKNNDPKHTQLRKQFEEKNVVLHDTRKELFHAKETLIAMQLKSKEKQAFVSNDVDQILEELADLEEVTEHLKKENEALMSFVSLILKKQKVVAVEKDLPFT